MWKAVGSDWPKPLFYSRLRVLFLVDFGRNSTQTGLKTLNLLWNATNFGHVSLDALVICHPHTPSLSTYLICCLEVRFDCECNSIEQQKITTGAEGSCCNYSRTTLYRVFVRNNKYAFEPTCNYHELHVSF
jgi:hypothetical protein